GERVNAAPRARQIQATAWADRTVSRPEGIGRSGRFVRSAAASTASFRAYPNAAARAGASDAGAKAGPPARRAPASAAPHSAIRLSGRTIERRVSALTT